jgi:hypothetical protein
VKLAAAAALAAAAFVIGGSWREHRPLWPGARFTAADHERALRRGLFFLYAAASQRDTFREWGHDLLSAFVNIAATNADREISDLAWRMGHERAMAWRGLNREVPANADADDIANLVYGSDAAEALGVPDRPFHDALVRAASRFSTADYLGFDPRREPPPAQSRYEIFQDALIGAYTFDHYDVPIGARYTDVLRWLPAMHPYPARGSGLYYRSVYTITHVVYTYNGYNQYRIAPKCFPDEFAYLNANFEQAIADNDPETLGEYLDTLQAFGLTWADSRMRRAVESLLAAQNPDGSWGNPKESDPYTRYHSTWTALDGIQQYRARAVLPCP